MVIVFLRWFNAKYFNDRVHRFIFLAFRIYDNLQTGAFGEVPFRLKLNTQMAQVSAASHALILFPVDSIRYICINLLTAKKPFFTIITSRFQNDCLLMAAR